MATVIESNSTLTILYLNTNRIGNEGAIAIAAALESNYTLTKLYLHGNKIDKEAQKVFDAAWAAHKEKMGKFANQNICCIVRWMV